jgi:hypothetical protein
MSKLLYTHYKADEFNRPWDIIRNPIPLRGVEWLHSDGITAMMKKH